MQFEDIVVPFLNLLYDSRFAFDVSLYIKIRWLFTIFPVHV